MRVQFDNYANFADIEYRWCYTLIKLNTELNIRLVLNKEEAMDQNTFAARLAAAMDSAGFKQADLVHAAEQRGEKLGRSQISQYVAGKSTPRREVLELLASLLAVEPDWLEGEPGQAEPSATTSPAQSQPASVQQQDSNPLDSSNPTDNQGSKPMRQFKKSSKLDNVLYDVRGPVVDEAARLESQGMRILKLNIGNPAPFGFRTPDEVVHDMRHQLPDCEGYSDSKGLFSARKAIMQYSQIKGLPNVDMDSIYTGNGVSELINLCMQALLDTGARLPAVDGMRHACRRHTRALCVR